jgi:hypothetical protein
MWVSRRSSCDTRRVGDRFRLHGTCEGKQGRATRTRCVKAMDSCSDASPTRWNSLQRCIQGDTHTHRVTRDRKHATPTRAVGYVLARRCGEPHSGGHPLQRHDTEAREQGDAKGVQQACVSPHTHTHTHSHAPSHTHSLTRALTHIHSITHNLAQTPTTQQQAAHSP